MCQTGSDNSDVVQESLQVADEVTYEGLKFTSPEVEGYLRDVLVPKIWSMTPGPVKTEVFYDSKNELGGGNDYFVICVERNDEKTDTYRIPVMEVLQATHHVRDVI